MPFHCVCDAGGGSSERLGNALGTPRSQIGRMTDSQGTPSARSCLSFSHWSVGRTRMPDVLSALIRLFSVQWQGVPVASLAVFAVGGLMYVAMSRSPTSATPQAPACVAPGGLH